VLLGKGVRDRSGRDVAEIDEHLTERLPVLALLGEGV